MKDGLFIFSSITAARTILHQMPRRLRKGGLMLFFTLLFTCALIAPSEACDYCMLTQGISPLDIAGSGIRINQRYTVLESVYNGTQRLANPGVREEYWTTEVTGFYSVNSDLMLFATLPYKKTRMNAELTGSGASPGADPDVRGGATGLGDTTLLGRFTFINSQTPGSSTAVAALAGIKLPTGTTNGKGDDGVNFLDAHLQTGTGSVDYLIGLSVSRSYGALSVSSNLLATITTEGVTGDRSHQFGNILNYDVTGKYRLTGGGETQVYAALGINGELVGREKDAGDKLVDSGGNTVYLSPGVQVVIAPHWVVEVSYQHALYHNLYATQLGEGHKINGGVTYMF